MTFNFPNIIFILVVLKCSVVYFGFVFRDHRRHIHFWGKKENNFNPRRILLRSVIANSPLKSSLMQSDVTDK